MCPAKCPYCPWESSKQPPDGIPPLLHAAMQLQEHLVDAHWLSELEATDVADLWAAVTSSQVQA